MAGQEYRVGVGGLCRWTFISPWHQWRDRVGGGEPGDISRKGPLHSAGSTEQETVGGVSGGCVCVSGHRWGEALHARSRDTLGLRHQGKPLGSYTAWNRSFF